MAISPRYVWDDGTAVACATQYRRHAAEVGTRVGPGGRPAIGNQERMDACIGAGSVVTSDAPPRTLAADVPARVIQGL